MAKSEYPTETNTFGEKIRKKRMDSGWSLLKVADDAEISESYLARIEANKQKPTTEVALKIISALNENPKEYYSFLVLKALTPRLIKNVDASILEDLKKPYAWEKVTEISGRIKDLIHALPPSKQRSELEIQIKKLQTLAQKNTGDTITISDYAKFLIENKE